MSRFAKALSMTVAVAAFALLFAAIGSPRATSADTDLKATITNFYAAANAAIVSGDTKALEAFLSPDYTDSTGTKGIDSVRNQIKSQRTGFPDLKYTVSDVLVDGTKAAVFSVISGTFTGTVPGYPTTGKALSLKNVDLITFKDGLIVSISSVADNSSFFDVLGYTMTAPTPAATAAATPAK